MNTPILANRESIIYRVLITICGGLLVYYLPFLVKYFQRIKIQTRMLISFCAVVVLYLFNIPGCLKKTYSDLNPPLGEYLSFGYFENFLRPLAESAQKNSTTDISIKKFKGVDSDTTGIQEYKVYILVPKVLDIEMKNQISEYQKKYSLDTVSVKYSNRNLLLYGKKIKSTYYYFDFPTTLISLLNYVKNTAPPECDLECKQSIILPEIERFKNNLGEHLLASEYLTGKVHIRDLDNPEVLSLLGM